VDYDGKRILIGLESTGFEPTGEFTADIFYTVHFPDGRDVEVVEHSTAAPGVGPLASFTADIDVLSGGIGGPGVDGSIEPGGRHCSHPQLPGHLVSRLEPLTA